tara:strand:+ start:4353 stop:5702 length:1350 start_codon:yes stop_codon:yes gene_type:complete
MTSHFEPVLRLPNMQDVGPETLDQRDAFIKTLRGVLSLRGYERAETPILEQTELYIRKSGGELSSRLYDFSEPGGMDVSLRPEFTAAILRKTANYDLSSGPARIMYDGPVFRYASPEDADGDKTRQFNQFGAEMIGAEAPYADGEVIAMALEGLDALGVPDACAVVGHVGIIIDALNTYRLSERAKLFLINNINALKQGLVESVSEQADALGFTSNSHVDLEQTKADQDSISSTIEQVMSEGSGVTLGQNTGMRSREDIISRLAKKMSQADNPEDFLRALDMLSNLSQISGEIDQALDTASKVMSKSGIKNNKFESLDQVINAAELEGVSKKRISIDFGMARGVAYYTGMLFDVYSNGDKAEPLGGGGRYDGLTRALGYDKDIPSLGFAYNLDTVIDITQPTAESSKPSEIVSAMSEGSIERAVAKARRLRSEGKKASIDFANIRQGTK